MINFEDLGERFSIYMKIKGLGVNETAKILDFSGSQISNITKGRVFGSDKIFKILNIFTDLNPEWLFTGKGEMLKNEPNIIYSTNDTVAERLEYCKIKNGLTYYDLCSVLGITAGAMRGLINRNEVTEEHITAITEKFGISKKWFLTGEGEMPIIKNKEIRENINNLVAEPTANYVKGDGNKISFSEKEIELLKETIISLKEANASLKDTNELLKDKIKNLEIENGNLKNQ